MRRSTDRWWQKLPLLLLTFSTMVVLAGCPAPEGGVGGAEPGVEGEALEEPAGTELDGAAEEGGALEEENAPGD